MFCYLSLKNLRRAFLHEIQMFLKPLLIKDHNGEPQKLQQCCLKRRHCNACNGIRYKIITYHMPCFEGPCSRVSTIFVLCLKRLHLGLVFDPPLLFSLSCPKTRRNWGDRAFVSAAPRLWNSLPSNLKIETRRKTNL